MNNHPYRELAAAYARLLRTAYPLGGLPPVPHPVIAADAPTVLLLSPHPDDECITGCLPLRLLRELGLRVVNVPVTLGSRQTRQAARWAEVQAACAFLGFALTAPLPDRWEDKPAALAALLAQYRPQMLLLPHAHDANRTHQAVHHLGLAGLSAQGTEFACVVMQTEYWSPLAEPTIMVEADSVLLGDLMAALSCHVGEVTRNPYHLSLPAWMQDNVRRGAERIGGQGADAPAMLFATLYRRDIWQAGRLQSGDGRGGYGSGDSLAALLSLP